MRNAEWLTVAEAARLAGITASKLERLVTAGVITPTRIGATRCVRPETVDTLKANAGDRRKRAG